MVVGRDTVEETIVYASVKMPDYTAPMPDNAVKTDRNNNLLRVNVLRSKRCCLSGVSGPEDLGGAATSVVAAMNQGPTTEESSTSSLLVLGIDRIMAEGGVGFRIGTRDCVTSGIP